MYRIIVTYVGLFFVTGVMQCAEEGVMGSTIRVYWKKNQSQSNAKGVEHKYIVIKDRNVYAHIIARTREAFGISEGTLIILKDCMQKIIDQNAHYHIPKGLLAASPCFFFETVDN